MYYSAGLEGCLWDCYSTLAGKGDIGGFFVARIGLFAQSLPERLWSIVTESRYTGARVEARAPMRAPIRNHRLFPPCHSLYSRPVFKSPGKSYKPSPISVLLFVSKLYDVPPPTANPMKVGE